MEVKRSCAVISFKICFMLGTVLVAAARTLTPDAAAGSRPGLSPNAGSGNRQGRVYSSYRRLNWEGFIH